MLIVGWILEVKDRERSHEVAGERVAAGGQGGGVQTLQGPVVGYLITELGTGYSLAIAIA